MVSRSSETPWPTGFTSPGFPFGQTVDPVQDAQAAGPVLQLPEPVGVVPPRLFVESQVGDTPEGRGGTHEMCEVDDSHVVRVVTVRAAVDAPVALIVCLASNPENRLFLQESGGSLRVADEDDQVLRELMSGAPRGWSNWTACPQGCCLSYDGGDKANYMAPWLKFLMATFLVPGATAEGTDGLSCDYVLSGMVVGSRRDTREPYSITVRDDEVEVELLWPGNPKWSDYPRLAYQTEIDRFRNWVADRKARE